MRRFRSYGRLALAGKAINIDRGEHGLTAFRLRVVSLLGADLALFGEFQNAPRAQVQKFSGNLFGDVRLLRKLQLLLGHERFLSEADVKCGASACIRMEGSTQGRANGI